MPYFIKFISKLKLLLCFSIIIRMDTDGAEVKLSAFLTSRCLVSSATWSGRLCPHYGSKLELWKKHSLLGSTDLNTRPLLGNGSINTYPYQRICTRNNRRTVESGVLCCIRAEAISGESRPTNSQDPCVGGFEYLRRSHASHRRRRKGNSVPGGIIGPPCHWETQIWWPGPPGWESLESETVKCGHKSRGPRTWLRWRGAAAIVNDRPILSSERMLLKDYDCKCSVEKMLVVSLKGLVSRWTDWQ
jgi:hypothetical protein